MRAFDVHSHWGTQRGYRLRTDAERGQLPKVWKSEVKYETEDEMAENFRSHGVRTILDFGFTKTLPIAETVAFHDYAFGVQRAHPDAIFGHWINIDPRPGDAALAELQRCHREAPGFIGFMVSGGSVGVPASDPMLDPFYRWCAREGVPVLILVGYTGTGAGLPGGSGVRLQHCHPLHVDDVAARYADLRIIAGRPAWPWQDDMIAILLHKPNVWYELHGWSPKHFTASLKYDLPRRLKNQAMFGADYPLFSYDRLFADWAALGYSDEVMEKLYWGNAEAFFGRPGG